MIPRCKTGAGVSGAVRYALGEGNDPATGKPRTGPKGETTRVAWFGGTGFGFEIESRDDADLARRIMEFSALNQASRTRLCVKDCLHLSLGWRPGEEPTRAQMEEAAHMALAAIGMSNARALFASHADEPYAHLHIVASKIDPTTNRAYDLKSNYLKLSKWAEQYERDHSGGIVCTRREEANQLRDAIGARDAGAVLDLLTQQRATFKGADLERVLSKQIKSVLERGQFAEKILTQPETVRLSDEIEGRTTRYTTKAVLEAEGQVLRAAGQLAVADHHGVEADARRAVFERPEFEHITREQYQAVVHATQATGLALIDGQAGTGKSYTIDAIRKTYEAEGYDVRGLAPTNVVADDMRDNGFGHAATIHSELFKLNNARTSWTARTVVVVDEAAMIDTKLMAQLTTHAYDAGAKLILVGDDRQLSSIDRGGMFGVLKDQHGAAELSHVRRQHKPDDKRAAELMAEGGFDPALRIYEAKGAIHWTQQQDDARTALVAQWAKDNAADPSKSRFVFAYTNAEVDRLNAALREVRKERGEIGAQDHSFETKHGSAAFAERDRIQITGTDKARGLVNGAAGTIEQIDGTKIVVQLDGRNGKQVEIETEKFKDFRLGYAGTIFKGQGRTLDQTYLYHSEHWRSAASYVALTRHRDSAKLFVARNTAEDVTQLARQMGRVDDRRAASHFHQLGFAEPVRPLTATQLPTIELPDHAREPEKLRAIRGADSGGMVPQQRAANKVIARAKPSAADPARLKSGGNRPASGDPADQARHAHEARQRQQTSPAQPSDASARGDVPTEKRTEIKGAQEKRAKDYLATRDIGDGDRQRDRDRDQDNSRGPRGRGGRGRSR